MKTFYLGYKRQIHNFILKKGNCFAIIICWLYCSSIFVRYMPDNDPLAMIQDCFYGQAMSILIFMIFGMNLWRHEKKPYSTDFIDTLVCKPFFDFPIKLLVMITLCLFFSLLIAISNLFAYFYMKMPQQMIIYAMKMIGINFFFPIFESSLLGMIIGVLFKSRAKYIAVMFTWLITSPFASYIISGFVDLKLLTYPFSVLTYTFAILNFGSRMQTGATPMYGIPYDPYRLSLSCIKIVVLVSWLIAMLFCIPKQKHKRIWQYGVTVCMLTMIIAAILHSYNISSYKANVFSGIPETRRSLYDNLYYYRQFYNGGSEPTENALPAFDANDRLTIKSVDISLSVGALDMSVNCEMVAIAESEIEQQSFTLYRDYLVDTILLNGEEQYFERSGDYINLIFSHIIHDGEEIKLTFSYSGSSSPIYTATNAAIYLSANFAWLPECGMRIPLSPSYYTNTDMFTLYCGSASSDPVEYRLNFNSPYVTYVNLNPIDQTTWQGVSSDGVSICADALLSCKEVNNLMIYYPASIEPKLDRIVLICQHSARILEEVERILDVGSALAYDKLIILPVSPIMEYAGVIRNYRMHNDMMLYFESGFYLEGYMRRYPDSALSKFDDAIDQTALLDAMWAIINTPNCIRSFVDEPINQLFPSCFVQWYCAQNDLPFVENTRWMSTEAMKQRIIEENTDYTDEQLEKIDQIISQFNILLQTESPLFQSCLAQWYKSISDGNPFSPDGILDLFRGVRR